MAVRKKEFVMIFDIIFSHYNLYIYYDVYEFVYKICKKYMTKNVIEFSFLPWFKTRHLEIVFCSDGV